LKKIFLDKENKGDSAALWTSLLLAAMKGKGSGMQAQKQVPSADN
jgi:hypothetical protein